MTEATPEVTLPAAFAAQVQEAAAPKPQTKTVMWHGRGWQVRPKPGAVFLDRFEKQQLMGAAKSVLGEKQYEQLLDLDPDVEGDDGMDGFFKACNRAWGLEEGN